MISQVVAELTSETAIRHLQESGAAHKIVTVRDCLAAKTRKQGTGVRVRVQLIPAQLQEPSIAPALFAPRESPVDRMAPSPMGTKSGRRSMLHRNCWQKHKLLWHFRPVNCKLVVNVAYVPRYLQRMLLVEGDVFA